MTMLETGKTSEHLCTICVWEIYPNLYKTSETMDWICMIVDSRKG